MLSQYSYSSSIFVRAIGAGDILQTDFVHTKLHSDSFMCFLFKIFSCLNKYFPPPPPPSPPAPAPPPSCSPLPPPSPRLLLLLTVTFLCLAIQYKRKYLEYGRGKQIFFQWLGNTIRKYIQKLCLFITQIFETNSKKKYFSY